MLKEFCWIESIFTRLFCRSVRYSNIMTMCCVCLLLSNRSWKKLLTRMDTSDDALIYIGPSFGCFWFTRRKFFRDSEERDCMHHVPPEINHPVVEAVGGHKKKLRRKPQIIQEQDVHWRCCRKKVFPFSPILFIRVVSRCHKTVIIIYQGPFSTRRLASSLHQLQSWKGDHRASTGCPLYDSSASTANTRKMKTNVAVSFLAFYFRVYYFVCVFA